VPKSKRLVCLDNPRLAITNHSRNTEVNIGNKSVETLKGADTIFGIKEICKYCPYPSIAGSGVRNKHYIIFLKARPSGCTTRPTMKYPHHDSNNYMANCITYLQNQTPYKLFLFIAPDSEDE